MSEAEFVDDDYLDIAGRLFPDIAAECVSHSNGHIVTVIVRLQSCRCSSPPPASRSGSATSSRRRSYKRTAPPSEPAKPAGFARDTQTPHSPTAAASAASSDIPAHQPNKKHTAYHPGQPRNKPQPKQAGPQQATSYIHKSRKSPPIPTIPQPIDRAHPP